MSDLYMYRRTIVRLYQPMNHRFQSWLFLLIILVIPGVVFLWQIWHLLPLYTNTGTRDAVKTAMTTVATREGWLLSDMLVTDVADDRIRLIHRAHRRGDDPESCHTIALTDFSLHPCD